MSSYEYNQLLKFLYFEGYADSYAEAEELLESMSDDEFEDLTERMRGDDGSEDRNSAQIRRDNEYFNKIASQKAAKKAAQEKLKSQGLKRKDGTPVFEEVIEYLFVEGYADTIEGAEEMAENISETWVNEIIEAKVDWYNRDKSNVQDRVGVLRDRNRRLQSDRPEIPSGRDQTDFRTKRHQDSRGKKGSVTEENYEIDEAAKDQSDKQIDQGVKKTYKAGNVLDNTHQGRSPGLNKLPRSERDAKVKRMRERLNARRDDLFKERGNREDAKREQLKKLLGL